MEWLVQLSQLDLSSIGSAIGLIISIPAALMVIHKWIFAPAYRFVEHLLSCLSRAEGYMGVLDNIAAEFKPNGGNSFKDVLNRIDTYIAVSNTKIQSIMNYHGIPAWESDATGGYVWASDELLELMQLSREEMLGLGWLSAIWEDDRARVRGEWDSAVAENRNFHCEYRVGIRRPISVTGRAIQIRDAAGNLKGFVGILKPLPASAGAAHAARG